MRPFRLNGRNPLALLRPGNQRVPDECVIFIVAKSRPAAAKDHC